MTLINSVSLPEGNKKEANQGNEQECSQGCKMRGACPIPGDQGVSAIFKKRYCDNNWVQCARYRLHNLDQPITIPTWLLPNMADEAQSLLEQYC